MKVLLACENSGITSQAFRSKGHEVFTCDLMPLDKKIKDQSAIAQHLQCDVLRLMNNKFDLVIAHPPCTYLCIASSWRWHSHRQELMKAFSLVLNIWHMNTEMLCIENPVGWLNNNWKTPSQIISPHNFGSRFQKRTCLWLRNLPPLLYGCYNPQKREYMKQWGSNHNKEKLNSRSFPEIAAAMAEQWNF